MPKIEKGSSIYKMFNDWYKLIQVIEVPKSDKELDEARVHLEEWSMTLPQDAQLLAMCMSYGYARYLEYLMRGISKVTVYRREDGKIAIKGKIDE